MFSAVIQSDGHFYFILPLDIDEIKEVRKIEIDLLQLLSSDIEWGILRNPLDGGSIQFRRSDGKIPKLEDITILAVLSTVVTTTMSLGTSSPRIRVVPLPDFITLFDSFEDSHELEKFWKFLDSNERMISSSFYGLVDHFAAFRDSDAVLIGGAITPDLFLMDPHWGAEWRYRILSEFWQAAPLNFLDDSPTWITKSAQKDDPKCLISKSGSIVDWCTLINNCTVHFAFDMSHQELDRGNGRMLELFTQCVADAFSQRKTLIKHLDLFSKKQVVIMCRANTQALITPDFSVEMSQGLPLLSNWRLLKSTDEFNLRVSVDINLTMVREELESPSNAIFEAECTVKALLGLMAFVSDQLDLELSETLYKTGERVPRFLLEVTERKVDTPDFSMPIVPKPEHYKIARREIAIILKDLNFLPGRYELETAKTMIDPARDAFRSRIHGEIGVYDQHVLARFCVEQHEALMAKYHRDIKRIELSQRHEVSFERSEAFAELTRDFTRESKNYRYLLECCLSMATSGKHRCTEKDVVGLLASIDWLFVFYYASDAIHNDIDIAGLEIENDYVPHVFYSEDRDNIEQAFELERANTNLGLGIQSSDAVYSSLTDDFNELDSAFILDVGFSFTQLSQMFYVLSKWPSMQGKAELLLSYQASHDEIANVFKKVIEGELTEEQSKKLLDLITLDANTIRRLAGKSINESDVPVWEHFKRIQRYAIKPLIKMEDGSLVWGTATVDKARQIWWGQFISNGYLPADFDWPNVKKVVENIHMDTDKQLEITALDVCKRTADYVIGNIDFKNRFPKENFDDVGDFDVLVFWPNTNIWLIGECKNNQPPHCIKDARRLREQIFGGRNPKRAQFPKIERRRNFLRDNLTHIRELLKWPAPTVDEDALIVEVYISRDIYWWMRNHPYRVPTEFVRVDRLASWLQEKDFSNRRDT